MTADSTRLPLRRRILLALNALDARVLRLPCEVCGDRRRCWRWHVEVTNCPTCGTELDEFHPAFPRVMGSRFTSNSVNFGNGNLISNWTTGNNVASWTITNAGWTFGNTPYQPGGDHA